MLTTTTKANTMLLKWGVLMEDPQRNGWKVAQQNLTKLPGFSPQSFPNPQLQ